MGTIEIHARHSARDVRLAKLHAPCEYGPRSLVGRPPSDALPRGKPDRDEPVQS